MADVGSAVTHLRELGRRYDGAMRIATGLPTLAVATLAARTTPSPSVTYMLLALTTTWSLVYVRAMRRQPGAWATMVDALVLAILAASTPWTVPQQWLEHGRSWLLPFLAFACVGYQYSAGWRLGAIAAALVLGGAMAGTANALSEHGSLDSLVTAGWSVVVAGLARMLWTLMQRGAKLADDAATDAESARAQQATETAVRAAKREHNRTLHDTAATTLLWVGTGSNTIPGELLAEQAGRDLEKLLSFEDTGTEDSDLIPQLQRIVDLTMIRVDFSHPKALRLPRRIAVALTGATSEAIANVANHAGVDHCRVTVQAEEDTVCISIADQGRGFRTEGVPNSRHGVRESIQQRIKEVGGLAEISSRPGRGTTVRLEWRR